MRRTAKISTAARVLVVALLLAACGEEPQELVDADTSRAGESDADPTDAGAEQDDSDDDGESETADPADADPADGDTEWDVEAFETLLDSDAPIAITYEAREDENHSMTVTFARRDGTLAMSGVDRSDEYHMIYPGEGSPVICGTGAGTWHCLRFSGMAGLTDAVFGASFAPFLVDTRTMFGDVDWHDVGGATIAGRSASCASTSLGLDFGQPADVAELCVDEETGALLRVTGEADGETVALLEAVDVGDPEPALFDPPVEPIEFDLAAMFGVDDLADLEDLGLEMLEDLEDWGLEFDMSGP